MRDFIKDGIETVCGRFKGRAAGSKSEYACQKYFARELQKWSDRVETEAFRLHPKAFLGWILLCASAELLAIVLLWIGAVSGRKGVLCTALLLTAFSACLAWFEFFRYREFIDFLFPAATSHNVYAVRESEEAPKRRIIFGGHADAAYEFTFVRKANGTLCVPLIVLSVTGVICLLAASAVSTGAAWKKSSLSRRIRTGAAIVATAFAPVFVLFLFFTNWKCVTDGANDNLSACYAAFAVMRHLEEHRIRFKNTEVCCLITGSEEAGLRGAKAFAKRHRQELTEVETVFIAMDTLRETGQLQVYTNGMLGMQRSSEAVGDLVLRAARDCGAELRLAKPYPGAVDSDAFAQAGLLACGLCGVDHDPKPYYHTRLDTADNIDPDCIELCARICLRAAELYDRRGIGERA